MLKIPHTHHHSYAMEGMQMRGHHDGVHDEGVGVAYRGCGCGLQLGMFDDSLDPRLLLVHVALVTCIGKQCRHYSCGTDHTPILTMHAPLIALMLNTASVKLYDFFRRTQYSEN